MEYFQVRNWDKFQHYKDRNPPWIKLHTELLYDYKFICLQDASKLQLMLIWMLAAKTQNKIPCDVAFIQNALNTKADIDLQPLFDAGFIEIAEEDSNALAEDKQSAIPEERRGETEEREKIAQKFAIFWSAYPKKKDKAKAEKAFKKSKIFNGSFDHVLAKLEEQKNSDDWIKDGGKFIPYPTTWLNGKRWEDEGEKKDEVKWD